MKKITVILTTLVIISLYGCGPNRMYHYGDYSSTLYDYRKDSNGENLARHISEMESIVAESKEEGKRVPPGLYGEMGYMYMKTNKKGKAVEYFNLEKTLYPESRVLMDRMIKSTSDES